MRSYPKLLLICIVAIGSLWSTMGCQRVNQTRSRRIVNKAIKAMRASQYSKARSFLKQAIALDPMSGHARYILGRVYEAQSDLMQAEEVYKQSIQVDGKNYRPHFQLGGIYLKWKKYALSAKHYEKVIALKPKHHLAVYQLGLAYHKQKKFVQAAAQLNKAIELKPKFTDAFNNLLLVYYDQAEKARLELGDDQAQPHYAKAVAVVERAKRAGIVNEQTYNTLGLVYQKQKKFQQAIDAFDLATKAKPYFSISAYNRGATYDMWLEEMLKLAREEKDRSKIKDHAAKAAVYRDAAIKAFKKFVQLHQGNQAMRSTVREKIMRLKLMQEKEMYKRIKRERREIRRKRRRRRR